VFQERKEKKKEKQKEFSQQAGGVNSARNRDVNQGRDRANRYRGELKNGIGGRGTFVEGSAGTKTSLSPHSPRCLMLSAKDEKGRKGIDGYNKAGKVHEL